MQFWHFTALHTIDLINIFCMWNYSARQSICAVGFSSHLFTLVPHWRPLFNSHCALGVEPTPVWEEGKGSPPLCTPALRERWGAHSLWQQENAPSVSIMMNVLLSSFYIQYNAFLQYFTPGDTRETHDLADISDKLCLDVY